VDFRKAAVKVKPMVILYRGANVKALRNLYTFIPQCTLIDIEYLKADSLIKNI